MKSRESILQYTLNLTIISPYNIDCIYGNRNIQYYIKRPHPDDKYIMLRPPVATKYSAAYMITEIF